MAYTPPGGYVGLAGADQGPPEGADRMKRQSNPQLNVLFRNAPKRERLIMRRAYRTFRRTETIFNARMNTITLLAFGVPVSKKRW